MPHSRASTEGQEGVGTADAGAGRPGSGPAAPGQAGQVGQVGQAGSARPADDDPGPRIWVGRDPGSLLWNP
jgi:hypothetical protein